MSQTLKIILRIVEYVSKNALEYIMKYDIYKVYANW